METAPKHEASFSERFSAALDHPVHPDFIDRYALDALDRVASITFDARTAYIKQAPSSANNAPAAIEDAALQYFGMSAIDPTLDHLQAKADEISSLDALIAAAPVAEGVLLPPESAFELHATERGSGEESEAIMIQRLKTVLFIAANEFGIDVHDDSQLQLRSGTISDQTARRASYYTVEIPSLRRVLLVCDQAYNASFICNTDVMSELGLTTASFWQLSKHDLRELMEMQRRDLGKRIIYSTNFTFNVIAALHDPTSRPDTRIRLSSTGKYLYPPAPPSVFTVKVFAAHNRVAESTVAGIMQELGIPSNKNYRFYRPAVGLEPIQQERIIAELRRRNLFNKPPDDGSVISTVEFAGMLGIQRTTVIEAVQAIDNDMMGTIQSYTFTSNPSPGYTKTQRELIRQHLVDRGSLPAPAWILSAYSIASVLHVDPRTVRQAALELGMRNSRHAYIFRASGRGGRQTWGYTPMQQLKIRAYIQKKPEEAHLLPRFPFELMLAA